MCGAGFFPTDRATIYRTADDDPRQLQQVQQFEDIGGHAVQARAFDDPAVRGGRQELRHEVSVRRMDLHAVVSGGPEVLGRPAEGVDHHSDLGGAHLVGRRRVTRRGDPSSYSNRWSAASPAVNGACASAGTGFRTEAVPGCSAAAAQLPQRTQRTQRSGAATQSDGKNASQFPFVSFVSFVVAPQGGGSHVRASSGGIVESGLGMESGIRECQRFS